MEIIVFYFFRDWIECIMTTAKGNVLSQASILRQTYKICRKEFLVFNQDIDIHKSETKDWRACLKVNKLAMVKNLDFLTRLNFYLHYDIQYLNTATLLK